MGAGLDCVVCLLRQSLEAARFASNDEIVHAKIIERTMQTLLEEGVTADPPYVGTIIHRLVREITGDPDPYYREKKRFNQFALSRREDARRRIEESDNPFETAVRLAIAGNSIDFAMQTVTEERISAALSDVLSQPLDGSLDELDDAIKNADSILYLTDNAGEIVYDRLLIERLVAPPYSKKVVVAVRGKPIINDALLEDAREAGLDEIAPVIDNGGDGLGVIFSLTSPEFQREFRNANLVIAKGLANYETLGVPGEIAPEKIAFLFKAKCPFIAERVGANLGDLVIRVQ